MSSRLTRNQKLVYTLLVAVAFCAMGFTMPSCPAQQAMQQQLDTIQTAHTEMTVKIRGLETQLKQAASDSAAAKQAVDQLNTALASEKGTVDALSASVQQLNAKLAAMQKPAGKTANKRRR